MKTKLNLAQRILKNCRDFYAADPNGRRSMENGDGGSCAYNGAGGCHCAFAREVKEKFLSELDRCEGNSADYCLKKLGHKILKRGQKLDSMDFWNELQAFHDRGENWDTVNNTISETGKKNYEALMEDFENFA